MPSAFKQMYPILLYFHFLNRKCIVPKTNAITKVFKV